LKGEVVWRLAEMIKKYHFIVMVISYLSDILLTLSALFLTNKLLDLMPLYSSSSASGHYFSRTAFVVAALTWVICIQLYNLYDSKRVTSILKEFTLLTGFIVLFWIVFTSMLYFIESTVPLRIPLLYFGFIELFLLLSFRIALRVTLRFLRNKGHNLKKVLVIGAGPLGQRVAKSIIEHPSAGYYCIGFLDNDQNSSGQSFLSLPVLGNIDKIHTVVETMGPEDEIFVTLDVVTYAGISEIVHKIDDLPINVHIVPDIASIAYIQPQIEDLWGIPIIGIRRPAIFGFQAFTKRIIDIVGALLGLVVFSPLMIVAAILIKLDSPGPILFIQKRVGENGRIFKIFKFRTMIADSEAVLDQIIDLDKLEEPVLKLKNDPRVTRVGRLLRRTSLDELPQFINVLVGDMSLVGPRPEELRFVKQYTSWHRKRLMIKPGLTGPVQVNGRKDLTLKARVELEVDYIEKYSLLSDLIILIKTIPAVIRGNGSY
jgi:exopolysaccharide biosynthesis polyprenyl glycosylphosphotransferase